ncbi:MAG: hypothetical protein IIB95_04125 [Candidatus Marinimicrobia bacterium]|nr:hypothetical protein [Candidatus Neomarinimicrobiota bacterium]
MSRRENSSSSRSSKKKEEVKRRMKKVSFITIILIVGIVFIQPVKGISPVVKSFILPGLGEYALNEPGRGRTFIISETALWTSFAGALIISNNYTDRFQAFAADNAGVVPDGKNQQFWIDIGNYDSRDDHNEEHLRFREYNALYPNDAKWVWIWSSEKNRKQYRDYRISSDQWLLTAQFVAGGIVLNHIVSAIDALYLQRISHIQKITVVPMVDYEKSASGIALQIQF